MLNLFGEVKTETAITPRAYQSRAVESSFRLWDSGEVGSLLRIHTGGGKTICACLLFEKWLARNVGSDERYRCLVLSYEKQLVWQFAKEIEDVMGIRPPVEMEKERVEDDDAPIVVASRQSLLPRQPATAQQREWFMQQLGMTELEIGVLTKEHAMTLIRSSQQGEPPSMTIEAVHDFNRDVCAHPTNGYSRLHKFDWRHNWLVCMDEAHKWAMHLRSVGHLVEWFDQNRKSKRFGLTATPKRSDGVSIGAKLFPGVAIDYSLTQAVKDGYAVPYKQRFISVEGVEFKTLGRADFDEGELEKQLGTEKKIASLVDPTLDLAGDRQTLIYSPGVEMAKDVAAYINVRAPVECICGRRQWVPHHLVGDGAKCKECREWILRDMVVRPGPYSQAVYGTIPPWQRHEIFAAHQKSEFQFLSLCALAREGYNDPNASCIAIFRPVSKKASSLAEQMKGRGSRPLRGLVEGLDTREERLEAIGNSDKPDCLIIDLVGVTGLADCASTFEIYAEGEDDEVVERANEIGLSGGMPEGNVQEILAKAKEEIEAEREIVRQREQEYAERKRTEAQRRAKVGASVDYKVYSRGCTNRDPSDRINLNSASEKQVNYIGYLGLDVSGVPLSRRQARRIIGQLQSGMDPDEVKYSNRLPRNLGAPRATDKQKRCLRAMGVRFTADVTKREASELIDQVKTHGMAARDRDLVRITSESIEACQTQEELTVLAMRIRDTEMADGDRKILYALGRKQRKAIGGESF